MIHAEKNSGNEIPKLRFLNFDGTWKKKKLSEILKVKRERNVNNKYSKEEVLSVSGELGIINQIEHLGRSYAGFKVDNYHVVDVGDIVYTKSPLKKNPYGIIKSNKKNPGIVSTLYAVYEVKAENDYRFLDRYFELDDRTNGYLRPLVHKGAKNDMKINNERVLIDSIFVPSFLEQKKIADFFDSVDNWIKNFQQQKERLDQYKNGMLQKIFSQNFRFKDDNGNDFPEWEEKTLGEIIKIGSGKDFKHLETGNVPVFGTGGYMTSVNKSLYSGESVFIGRKGTIDKPFYYNGDFWTVDTLFYTYDFKDVIPKFVYLLFIQINWKKHNEASGVPSLSKAIIEKLKVILPSPLEQEKIVQFIFSIEAQIKSKQMQIEKAIAWKKGLMQQLFI